MSIDVQTKFRLEGAITDPMTAFLDEHGFLHFKGVLSRAEVDTILDEAAELEARLLRDGQKSVFGIPLFFGQRGDGQRILTRMCFTSVFSSRISAIIRDERFLPLLPLVGDDARIGEREKDGVVINRYLRDHPSSRPKLGWHTDGLRDLFYLRKPQQMLNFGLHLTDCPRELGGLRLLPGTHTQSFWQSLTGKAHFVDHRDDPRELCVEAEAGDLTVHDGRLWHRVAMSTVVGPASERRSLFVPIMTGPVEIKDEGSPTPLYHHFASAMRWLKSGQSPVAKLLPTVG